MSALIRSLIRLVQTQPAAVGAVIALLYGAGAMVYRAWIAKDLAVIDWDIVGAAITAGYLLFVKGQVTPLADPKTKAGSPLTVHAPLYATRPDGDPSASQDFRA